MKRRCLGLIVALLVVTVCTSCAFLKTVISPLQNPTFQMVTGSIAEACGPQYGAMARIFFRIIGTQTEASIVHTSPATSAPPSSGTPSPSAPPPSPSTSTETAPPPGNVYMYTPSERPAAPTALPSQVKPTDLQIEFELLRELLMGGRSVAVRVNDGDTLTEQDNYRVYLRANMDCYLYVVQLDATGKLDPIFPRSQWTTAANPVKAGVEYFIPAGNDWFYLDENKGIEHVFLLASKTANAELDKVLDALIEANKTLKPQKPFVLETPVVVTRGVGSVRPSGEARETALPGGKGKTTFNPFTFAARGDEMVETRWFYHK